MGCDTGEGVPLLVEERVVAQLDGFLDDKRLNTVSGEPICKRHRSGQKKDRQRAEKDRRKRRPLRRVFAYPCSGEENGGTRRGSTHPQDRRRAVGPVQQPQHPEAASSSTKKIHTIDAANGVGAAGQHETNDHPREKEALSLAQRLVRADRVGAQWHADASADRERLFRITRDDDATSVLCVRSGCRARQPLDARARGLGRLMGRSF